MDVMRLQELGSVSRSVEHVVLVFSPWLKHCSKNRGVELKVACADRFKEGVQCLLVGVAPALNST